MANHTMTPASAAAALHCPAQASSLAMGRGFGGEKRGQHLTEEQEGVGP